MTAFETVEARVAENPDDVDNVLKGLILTCAGRSKEVKTIALDLLLDVARAEAVAKERARFRAQFIQE